MGFLKDLINGHEAFFAASDEEKGWGTPIGATTPETTEEESQAD